MAQGGKSFQDRELAARVRSLTLLECEKALKNREEDEKLYQAVLLKLAGGVLPRLNEHAGEGGGPVIFEVAKEVGEKHGLTSSSS